MKTIDFVRESNKIEGILREPNKEEIDAHDTLMGLGFINIDSLEWFVSVYQPGARLRLNVGDNVRVGNYIPPSGGQHIIYKLEEILFNSRYSFNHNPYAIHCQYESLHPFTDCNGRSGRVFWAWMMNQRYGGYPLGFLHHFYYQSLDAYRK